MGATILRKDVIKAIESGQPFDMVYLTCNRRRPKEEAGEIITVEGWLKVSRDKSLAQSKPEGEAPGKDRKDPHHREHGTVNIFNPANTGIHPHKVHYDLIQFFNGKRVIN